MPSTVPNLTTAQTAPLLHFEKRLLERATDIETWFRGQWLKTPAPFYCSVDLRNAGFKLAPVDTNLFPAGFNNLNPAFEALCVQALQAAMERHCASAARVLLIPESHTRNLFYLENVATLRNLLVEAGYAVRIGSLAVENEPQRIDLQSGKQLVLEKLTRRGDRIGLADFDPCVVLLNNDLSGGRPAILEDVEQPVLPPMDLGWSDRLKSGHFGQYAEVARDFGALLDLDPWWIAPLHRNCGQVDFMKREGEDCLVANAEMLLGQIQEKYDEYGVRETPFVVVKAEAGTYGMGVMVVRNVDELREMNRNARKKMASAKEGRSVTGAIIQEGVYTFERWTDEQTADATAEPVVYMIDHFVVGGFYRIHPERGNTDNLNAPGAQFRPLAFAEPCTTPRCDQDPDARPNRFYAYGVVARLALLAAAREQAVALAADARVAA